MTIPRPNITKAIGLSFTVCMVAMLTAGSLGANSTSPQFIARVGSLSTQNAQISPPGTPPAVVQLRYVKSPVQTETARTDDLVASGGSGFVMAGNNCVACVRAMTGRGQNGNAGTWRATSSTPSIGAIMIFRPGQQGASGAGHVGVVKGIRNGKILLAHCNWGGGQTEFYSTGLFF